MSENWKSEFEIHPANVTKARYESAINLVCDILARQEIHAFPLDGDLNQIRQQFEGEWPEKGATPEALLDRIKHQLVPHSRNKRSPKYFAHMDVPPSNISVFSGALIRALAQDPISISSAVSGTFMEKQVTKWLTHLVYGDIPNAGGVFTTGGTQSNLQALLLLRNIAFDKLGINVSEVGLPQALKVSGYKKIAILTSERSHESIRAAVSYLGLGRDSLHVIGTDESGGLCCEDLGRKITTLEAEGGLPICLVLTACTTDIGAIDPLDSAIDLSEQHDIPVHVDAAHGGMLLFSKRHQGKLRGIERANTVTIDPHKILGVNQSLGFLAVKDTVDFSFLGKAELPYYSNEDTADLGVISLDNSRQLNSLSAWMMMLHLGRQGYSQLVEHLLDLSHNFSSRLDESPFFEIAGAGLTNVLAYRFSVAGMGLETENKINEHIFRGVMSSQDMSISRFTDSNGVLFLRSVFVNPNSSLSDVHALSEKLITLGISLKEQVEINPNEFRNFAVAD